jgi:hypothetical protein
MGALGIVHPALPQQPKGVAIPDAIADCPWTQGARDFDDGFDQMPVHAVALKVMDEVLVDFQVVHGQPLQM